MSRRATAVSVIASAVIVLSGWRLGTRALAGTEAPVAVAGTSAQGAQASSGAGNAIGQASGSAAAAGYRDGSYTGAAADNPYGSWTVSITVSGGKISDVSASTTASDGQSRRIASRALPTLRSEVLASQNATVNTVSGATYTSESYLTSLQSALDKAAA